MNFLITEFNFMIRYAILLIYFLCSNKLLLSQTTFPVNGVNHPDQTCYLFKNATIHVDPISTIENGMMLIRNGNIVAIGPNINIPIDAIIRDLSGAHIYPSFIEILSDYGIPEPKKIQGIQSMISNKEGAFSWNEALRPEINASELFTVKNDQAGSLRDLGFGTVNTHYADGISRGSSTIVLLGDRNEHLMMLKSMACHVLSFNKGLSSQDYPSSLMGSIALLRQTYMDGKYYQNSNLSKEINLSLQAWNEKIKLPQIFIANDKYDVLRADRLAKEFNQTYMIKTGGDEYQRIEEIKKTNAKLIVPLNFPPLYEVEDPYDALQIDLSDLKHWELAPSNPHILEENSIPFVFTSNGLRDRKLFLDQIRTAISRGLSPEKALFAITQGPAEFLEISNVVGSLKQGFLANFIITNGQLFDTKTIILENWIKGNSFTINKPKVDYFNSGYQFFISNKIYQVLPNSKNSKNEYKILSPDSSSCSLTLNVDSNYLSGRFIDATSFTYLLSATKLNNQWFGKTQDKTGKWIDFKFEVSDNNNIKTSLKKDSTSNPQIGYMGQVTYPFMAYGWTNKPKAQNILIKNATIWTCEMEGKLSNTDLLIKNGKIEKIGKDLSEPNVLIIDAQGKHITPGIIDEHSHIAISKGVNECTQSNTAEVRIGDVINPDDINIYRQLGGGVTTSQLLHGSCNPIGGQSAIIKLRWGSSAEDMKFQGADGFIKFALGENVKRSSGNNNVRYPDSRMGVEQIYVDAFTRAKRYNDLRNTKSEYPIRQDLELDALAEILNKKRFITCHSYVQSEINMLMHVATDFGFKINTFTHILEGYKVADKMKNHGVGASSFSDWWAYKFEVYEAIPYNGAILHDQGVVTAYNSDDAEMARRLNQEAAKAVKYGNVSEEEALKFVTLNPAKLLHIDNRVGSIKIGKDADFVIWNNHPLSLYASPEMTFIDGIKYYDKSQQEQLESANNQERTRIIQKMIQKKSEGQVAIPFSSPPKKLYHCEDHEAE